MNKESSYSTCNVSQYCKITLDVLLCGDESLSYERNILVLEAVLKCMQSSKR